MKHYACIDIGGTSIKYGVLLEDARILVQSSMPTEAQKGPSVWMQNVISVIEDMKKNYPICGICVSSTAMIDSDKGKVFFSLPQVPDYTGFDIKGFLEKKCCLPCQVENDVNSVVLAESISGAGKGYDTVLGLAIGTGIGGGFTDHGKLLHGASFSACEVGYIKVGNSDLEHTGSTTALCKRVAELKNTGCEFWNGRKVFELASKGDKDCILAIDEMSMSIAQGLVSLSYILNPHAIVLGGGIMNEQSLLDKIREYYSKSINPLISANTDIFRAKYGNNAGMIGALYHFLQKEKS